MNTYRLFSNFCLIFLLLCLVSSLSGQQSDFITYLDERTVNLPPQAQQRLDSVKARPTAIAVRLIQFHSLTTLASRQQLRIPIPEVGPLVATATRIQQPDTSKVFWSGRLQDNKSRLFFTVVDGDVTGMIHTERSVFAIEPIGAGHHVLIELDQSKFGPDEPPDAYSGPESEQNDTSANTRPESGNDALITSLPVIDLVVAYTPAVANASGNISSLIAACEQSANETLNNSSASATVEVVHSVEVSYNESGSTITDVNRLQGTNDGYMDNLHTLRDYYGADVVVLLIAYTSDNALGRAYQIEVSENGAFCVVEDNAAVGNYTFAHEIGHLVGGRHDNDPSGDYEHGYVYAPGYWRTVMAAFDEGINRLPYWSNPNKTYGGQPMGTTCCNDNTRKWNERASTVAGFRPSGGQQLDVHISGPGSLESYEKGTWTANASGGPTDSYSYEWRYRDNGTGSWSTVIGTTQEITRLMETTDFELQVKVSDSGADAYDTHYVYNGQPLPKPTAELPEQFALQPNYPNPFNPTTEIRFDLPQAGEVELAIFNLTGQKVRTLVAESKACGYNSVVRDGQDETGQKLASGVYLYRIHVRPNDTDSQALEAVQKMTSSGSFFLLPRKTNNTPC